MATGGVEVNSTAKGNRADLECRRAFEAAGYKTEKARVSRGVYDFVATRPIGTPCVNLAGRYNLSPSLWQEVYGQLTDHLWPWCIYVQVKCNAVGDARHKFQEAYEGSWFRLDVAALCLIAVRKDGRGSRKPEWRLEVWRPNG